MTQSRRMSALEATVNVCVGLAVSWAFTYWGLPVFGYQPSPEKAAVITGMYSVLSWVRLFAVRRCFA